MPYTIKTIRTRPSIETQWNSDELNSMLEQYEDISNEIDEEVSEDGLVCTKTFLAEILPDRNKEPNEYDLLARSHRVSNNISRTVSVYDESNNLIDSWED